MWLIDLLWPLAALFALLTAAFGVWALVSGRGKLLAAAAVCLLLSGGAFVADHLIVTEAERVEARMREVVAAAVAGDVDSVLGYFSPAAAEEQAAVRFGLSLVTIETDLRLSDWDTEVTAADTRATTHFRANGTVRAASFGVIEQHVATRWEFVWRKEAGAWKIVEIRRLDPLSGERIDLRAAR